MNFLQQTVPFKIRDLNLQNFLFLSLLLIGMLTMQ